MTIVVQMENPKAKTGKRRRYVPFGQQKKGFKFVLIVDLILTFIITVLCLLSMILVVIFAVNTCDAVSSEQNVKLTTPAPGNSSAFTNPVPANSRASRCEVTMTVVASDACFFLTGFLGMHLVSMFALWKGVIQKKTGLCVLWCVSSSLICATDIGYFIFIFTRALLLANLQFYPLPIFIYVVKGIHYLYRFYSIHLVGKMALESTVDAE